MSDFIKDQRIQIGYDPIMRNYFIPLLYKGRVTALQCLCYCPWCSKKLPTHLNDTWFEILEKEYNLDDPDSKEQELLVPQEFKTDEWWKKRGL
jgi:hypothetical protein